MRTYVCGGSVALGGSVASSSDRLLVDTDESGVKLCKHVRVLVSFTRTYGEGGVFDFLCLEERRKWEKRGSGRSKGRYKEW